VPCPAVTTTSNPLVGFSKTSTTKSFAPSSEKKRALNAAKKTAGNHSESFSDEFESP
jgi:hypothetical protein